MYQATTEADLKSHYRAIKKRLNAGPVPSKTPDFVAVRPLVDIVVVTPKPVIAPVILACDVPQRRVPRMEEIQRVVAHRYNLRRIDLLSSRRTANVVRPRQVAMYLAKTLTLRSLPEIGRRFGGRDHTTVLHAVRKIGEMVRNDAQFAAEIAAVRAAVLALPTLVAPLCPLCHQGFPSGELA